MTSPRSYTDFCQRLFQQEEQAFKLGTERIRAALDAHGAPDREYQSIIVAGTNGKGSVSSLIHAGLIGTGLTVGLFTSPHLLEVRERIRVDGRPISRPDLADLGSAVLDRWSDGAPPERRLTFFELTTLMACLYFRQMGVQLAVFEVGLGGRLDATNALCRKLGVVTPVGVDHIQQLGSDVASNFAEKKAILRRGVPGVVCCPDGWSTARTKAEIEKEPPDPLWIEGETFGIREDGLRIATQTLPTDWIPLPGAHQRRNAACALAALEAGRSTFQPAIPPLNQLPPLLARARWPGRWTSIQIEGRTVHLDCAHNPQGARSAAQFIEERFPTQVTLVMAVMARKQHEQMLDALEPLARRVVAVPLADPAALPTGVLASAVRARDVECVEAPTLPEGLEIALDGDRPVVCLGSIYLVGEVMKLAGITVDDLAVVDAKHPVVPVRRVTEQKR